MSERILIISDDAPNAFLQAALDGHGFAVTVAEDPKDGYELLTRSKFDLVIVNLNSSNAGVALVKQIRSNPGLPRMTVLTLAEWGTGQATIALAQGADGFEPAPVDAARLISAVEQLLRPNRVMIATASASKVESKD
ncbi:MAG: response regulator [Pyrinomonadaceae bacterium]